MHFDIRIVVKTKKMVGSFTHAHIWTTNSGFSPGSHPSCGRRLPVGLSTTAALGFGVAVCKRSGIQNLQSGTNGFHLHDASLTILNL